MERDSQRKRFFKAVKAINVFASPLSDMDALKRYIMAFDKATLKRRYGDAIDFRKWPTEIKDGRGYGRAVASPSDGWVTFPRNDRNTVMVLRTMAFIVSSRMSRSGDSRVDCGRYSLIEWGDRRSDLKRNPTDPIPAWHGWQYCSILLDLVRFMIGEQAEQTLKAAFDADGVRYRKPSTRNLSKSDKAALVERGERLGALMKDRRARMRFSEQYPEAPIISKDAFDGDWEDLYILWRP